MPLDLVSKAESKLFHALENTIGYRLLVYDKEIQELTWQLAVKAIAAAVKGKDQYVSNYHLEDEGYEQI